MTISDNINIAAGERIRALRGKRTQAVMAELAGVTQGQWSKFEKGLVPKIEVANKIAAALGTTIESICYGELFPLGTEKFRKFSETISGGAADYYDSRLQEIMALWQDICDEQKDTLLRVAKGFSKQPANSLVQNANDTSNSAEKISV